MDEKMQYDAPFKYKRVLNCHCSNNYLGDFYCQADEYVKVMIWYTTHTLTHICTLSLSLPLSHFTT